MTIEFESTAPEHAEELVRIRIAAMRESDSNRFYLHHGFDYQNELEWDLNYVRTRGIPNVTKQQEQENI